jgi:hypothetical protein
MGDSWNTVSDDSLGIADSLCELVELCPVSHLISVAFREMESEFVVPVTWYYVKVEVRNVLTGTLAVCSGS